ncbi:hypothetical protein AMAG_13790 [Allomyces macrogynus ATCC 38327]|uniref:NADH:flavin oxidoreductase/NADH oxidase N-terminal domain-containing protein n=1 Tax=Allomyces macrogynus (strain ATCC 38327) TaxID=578462 RepID=A0A0L0T3Z1_ALLM3|nr:hypothetical protein AMAG_13790 [Allomyces macrogynus ATCC 38327]|eukprot:KNE69430.1 hypothetical protein AMAG_13790 [Allomyces macrogynus ATCC 38327]
MSTPADFRVTQYNVPGAAKDPETAAHLFRPLTVRDTTFANRIFVSPMCQYSAQDGFATDYHLVHLGQFALRGVGLAMVEATAITPEGRISPQCLGLWKDEQIAPLKRIVDFYHANHGKIGIQLGHAGRKASTYPLFEKDGRSLVPESEGGWGENVVGPSAVAWSDYMATPKELTVEQIKDLVAAFVAAVQRAEEAGFDVVEIHGAHGYLIHEFLSPVSNQRTDDYGGSLENRARFLVELVEGARSVWPASKPLFLRLSCTDWVEDSTWDIDEVIEVVKRVAPLGVDVVDCSTGGNARHQKIAYGPLYQVPFAEQIKQAVPEVRTIAVGGITEATDAEAIIANGRADAVMLAREFLRDSWVARSAKALGTKIGFTNQYMYGAH